MNHFFIAFAFICLLIIINPLQVEASSAPSLPHYSKNDHESSNSASLSEYNDQWLWDEEDGTELIGLYPEDVGIEDTIDVIARDNFLERGEEYNFDEQKKQTNLSQPIALEMTEKGQSFPVQQKKLIPQQETEKEIDLKSTEENTANLSQPIASEMTEKGQPFHVQQKELIPQQETSTTDTREKNLQPSTTSFKLDSHKSINVNNFLIDRINQYKVALGAGDEDFNVQRGIWIRRLYGISNQDSICNISGYKAKWQGSSIGFDVEINNYIIGITYSNVRSVFNFKTNKDSDKELVKSHIFSIYGQKELPKNFTLQGVASIARNQVKNITNYSLNNIKYTSKNKYFNNGYNLETLLNYNYIIKYGMIIVPNFGLKYVRSHDAAHNENDVNIQNPLIRAKSHNIFTGIIGTKLLLPTKNISSSIKIGGTLQASIEQSFSEKTQKLTKTIISRANSSLEQSYIMPKQPKLSYNIGGNIFAYIKGIQISLDYNYHLHKYYRSHQGTIKLTKNF
ncbi:autotransporter outer membrane beta-barrel domain-containing protein [Rickettsia endosymbiont of Halotydeus destructor]|uniref:autotransporter outer membrane beta-barrel domain-containing protein n=1 Tax=Rickettsia endosymbiont of Halotydeus destructor TaxID=2996754 RepID=UPI003BAE577B